MRKLRLVNKAFRDALPAYDFTIDNLAKKFNMPARAISFRLRRLLLDKKAITREQADALAKKYYPENYDDNILTNKLEELFRLDSSGPFRNSFPTPEVVKELLQRGASTVIRGARSPLIHAIRKGHNSPDLLEIVKLLIDYGAIVNIQDGGMTPLIFAVIMQNADVVKQLIKAGAEVNMKSNGGVGPTALDYAKKYGNTEIVNLLKQAGAKG